MKCQNCGAMQPASQAFCDQCGRKLQTEPPPTIVARSSNAAPAVSAAGMMRCPNCQHPNPVGSNFCEECGATISAQSKQPPLPPTQVSSSLPQNGYAQSALPPTQVSSSLPMGGYAQSAPDPTLRGVSGSNVSGPDSSDQPPTQLYGSTDEGAVTQMFQRQTEVQRAAPRLVSNNGMTLNFKPGQTSWLIGREDPVSNIYPDVDLTPFDPGFTVSRRHAQLTLIGNQASLVSLTRTNWTKINGQRLLPDQPMPLQSGDQLEFSKVIVTFQL